MAINGVLVDTGPLVATANDRDPYHAACVAETQKLRGQFYTCWPVITEAAYLLRDRPVRVQSLLGKISTSVLQVLPIDASDMDGIAGILARYADQNFDFADATLMYLAERESIETVFTTDHRHFSIFRTSAVKPLVIRPTSL
jgi:predicted nucleic acid-binding protein